MKYIILILFSISVQAQDYPTVYPAQASKYLKSMECTFSAFATYTGEDVDNTLGTLKSGQAYSMAVCANTYQGHGATSRSYCWVRAVDLAHGQYIDYENDDSSDFYRDYSGGCTQDRISNILKRPAIRSQLTFGTTKKWTIVSDVTGAGAVFKKLTTASVQVAHGDYAAFRWNLYPTLNQCVESPEKIDELLASGGVNTYSIVSETSHEIVLKSTSDDVPMKYYKTKSECLKVQKVSKKQDPEPFE